MCLIKLHSTWKEEDFEWKNNFWNFGFFFQILQNFERIFTVLGEKLCGRDIKIELCTLCFQSIILRWKINFWKFCKFSFNWDLKQKVFGFVTTEVHPVCGNSILGVYMNSLWDVRIRSEKTWKEVFFRNLAEKFWPVC